MAYTKKKKKARKNVQNAQMHIHASFNNTIVSITDKDGGLISWSSAGSSGFKGSRKSTPYAAQIASEKALEKIKDMGVSNMDIFIRGVGPGRDSAIRALIGTNISVNSIQDLTGVPHNGCRPKKARRV